MNENPKKQAAEVVGEDRSQREEYVKRFRMTDRSWLAVAYPEAVHFEENGEWVEIDNRLEKKAVESSVPAVPEKGQPKTGEKTEKTIENAYVNTRNRFGVTLPVELDESRWIGVSDHGHSLYFRVDGISPSEGCVEEEPEKTGDALMDAIRVHLTGSLLYPELQQVRDSLQSSYFARQAEVEQRALELMKSDRNAAIAHLSDYSCEVGDQMVKRWRQMAYHMIVKYNDGVIRQEENGQYLRNSSGFRPRLTRPGMSDKVRRRIHQSTGTRFEVPPTDTLDASYM